ncbi:Uncharacterized protein BP5553_05796 [Venustampulla echinocandica]|uniref:glutamine--tRNA ligase n=1 Tax=Venustampulla echinocandica TaxID=2656787 RepID=A0A370TLP6_9HELO|nr:Uncharacterized protein BP5553_05796 [Venustampulla echinocandica]RDL36444.1 Uncharacterized protein BP5553_05796 [Venustampulla echinocandica]
MAKQPENAAVAIESPDSPDSMFQRGFLADVYNETALGTPEVDKIITRFPPEPNGFLHLGHSKAILINFGFAKFHGGECNLRFDDTNPAGEEDRYFVAIAETVKWLGFEPVKFTYSSDQFDRLYESAEQLINVDGAYVCHCTKPEIEAQRGNRKGGARYACPHRDRPISESLAEFRAMRDGKYSAQAATLRMKQHLESPNPQMWDLTAYRVLEGVYKPMQREYGRLNINGTVLSKRKLKQLVDEGYVRGWDDPRLYTLIALRRRGVPPAAILTFVRELGGVSKATTSIEIKRFESVVRKFLEVTVPRLMLILDPILVVIDNLPDNHLEMIDLAFSKDPGDGSHSVPFTNKVYIDRRDFREVASKDFRRLTPGVTVGLLKVAYPIIATSFEKDETTGLVTIVHASYAKPERDATFKKPKAYIQWVADCPSENSPIKVKVNVYNPLFNSINPEAHPNGFLADINPESEEIYSDALIENGLAEIAERAPWPKTKKANESAGNGVLPESVRFQGMRIGYFCLDSDSTKDKMVVNRIVSLKEDPNKG